MNNTVVTKIVTKRNSGFSVFQDEDIWIKLCQKIECYLEGQDYSYVVFLFDGTRIEIQDVVEVWQNS